MAADRVQTFGETAEAGVGVGLPMPGVTQDLGGGGGEVFKPVCFVLAS
ncbi:MAG: hypothetical protein HOB20_06225 [Planctomycetaceae bacterium]|jgi:hypothetical protein|nr:hypothetical protein [Planctomycetaceae bacterium]